MAITAQDVMKLRKMTSAGMMDCKKALAEAEGDFEKAVNIIREKGKLVAAKRADRETSEGAVLVRIQGTKGVIVCLGCETDFVSATPDFKALAAEIADAAIASFPADIEGLKASKCSNGHTVEEEISAQTGKTGEKHVLAYYAALEAPYIGDYVHFNGKLGAIVAFNKEIPAELGKAVAQQVTAMNPVLSLRPTALLRWLRRSASSLSRRQRTRWFRRLSRPLSRRSASILPTLTARITSSPTPPRVGSLQSRLSRPVRSSRPSPPRRPRLSLSR